MDKAFEGYKVDIKTLKQGENYFTFRATDTLFEEFEGSEISGGDVSIDLKLLKHTNLLELFFHMEGKVEVLCDRCLERFSMNISFDDELVIKISFEDEAHDQEQDDNFWCLSENMQSLDLTHYLYESICLSLPIQRYHGISGSSAEDCDKEMMEKFNSMSADSEQSSAGDPDPRWDKLKDLLQN